MPDSTRTAPDPDPTPPPREWLVTNGLGGYGSGTVTGELARRYHGLLVAAHPPPLGRWLTLVDLDTLVEADDTGPIRLGGHVGLAGSGAPTTPTAFELVQGLPEWTWEVAGRRIRRRLVMPRERNAVSVEYALLEGEPVSLVLRPLLQLRGHDEPVSTEPAALEVRAGEGGLVLAPASDGSGSPPVVRLAFPPDALWAEDARRFEGVRYRMEAERGYPSEGSLWSPGTLGRRLESGRPLTVVATTEPDGPEPDHAALLAEEIGRREALVERAGARGEPLEARLALAADSFLFHPPGRTPSTRSVIAGYPWFTDWGRDTMISLEGLTLETGREEEAAAILRSFGAHVRDGLIPNLFPEGDEEGLYHTADATLWYFHAVHRYVERTGDRGLLRELLPTLREIVERHIAGTRFGIGVDPADDLLRQGEEGYQLTWMDAKVDGWVVTPRRGKAVEVNALWYNALRLLAGWLRDEAGSAEAREGQAREAEALEARAERTRASFNRVFWNEDGGCLYDVIGPAGEPDPSFRPNQLLAIALDHPVLDRSRWAPVVEAVEARLLTPVGLRSLAPGDPDYAPRYAGDLRSRDAAYHQGTVWAWLIGPFIDAWIRIHPDRRTEARCYLDGLVRHLEEAGLGTLSEIFDAEPPYTPRGCFAQAWSVAEALRCLRRASVGEEGRSPRSTWKGERP